MSKTGWGVRHEGWRTQRTEETGESKLHGKGASAMQLQGDSAVWGCGLGVVRSPTSQDKLRIYVFM